MGYAVAIRVPVGETPGGHGPWGVWWVVEGRHDDYGLSGAKSLGRKGEDVLGSYIKSLRLACWLKRGDKKEGVCWV